MKDLLSTWQSLPPQTRFIIVSSILTVLVKLLRDMAPRLDGRFIHVLVGALGVGGAIVTSLIESGVSNSYLPLLSDFCTGATTALTAIGINELTRQRKKKGAAAPPGDAKLEEDCSNGDVGADEALTPSGALTPSEDDPKIIAAKATPNPNPTHANEE